MLDKKSVQAGVAADEQVVVIAERGRVRGTLTRRHAVRRAGPASYTLVACVAPHAASANMCHTLRTTKMHSLVFG